MPTNTHYMLTVPIGFIKPLVKNSPLPTSPCVGLANGYELVMNSSLAVVSVGSSSFLIHVCFDLLFVLSFISFSPQFPTDAVIPLLCVLLSLTCNLVSVLHHLYSSFPAQQRWSLSRHLPALCVTQCFPICHQSATA